MHVLPVLALALIDAYDTQIDEVERTVLKNAKITDPTTLKLLRTIPGIGKILSLVLLYEIDQITRFPAVGNFLGSSSPAK
jgi:transposase